MWKTNSFFVKYHTLGSAILHLDMLSDQLVSIRVQGIFSSGFSLVFFQEPFQVQY